MALGNNLKRVKKDNLIPEQKKEPVKVKAKTNTKVEAKQQTSKSKESIKPLDKKQNATQKSAPLVTANLEEKVLLGGGKNDLIKAKSIPSRRKSVRKTKLVFEGSLGILESKAIKDCLLSIFNDYDIVDIQLLNITHLDITALQLFSAFIDAYSDKKVTIDSELPFDLKIIVERAGYSLLMFKKEAA